MSCVVNFEYDFVEEDSGTSLLRNLSEHHTSELNGGFHNNIHIYICRFGTGSGPTWLVSIDCFGTESRLTSCSRRPVYDSYCEDVAIECNATDFNTNFDYYFGTDSDADSDTDSNLNVYIPSGSGTASLAI